MDYSQAYYNEQAWDGPPPPAPYFDDSTAYPWDLDAVAYGKTKGKGKPSGAKGYSKGGYQPGGKTQNGFGKGRGGKGKEKGNVGKGFTSQLKKNAAGHTVFMGNCYGCGCPGHTGKFCYLQNKAQGINTTCPTCGVWGHKPEYCPKTALAEVAVEVPPQGYMYGGYSSVGTALNQSDVAPPGQLGEVTSLGNSIDLCSVDQAISLFHAQAFKDRLKPKLCSGYRSYIGSCSCGHIYMNSNGEVVDTSVTKPSFLDVPQGIMSVSYTHLTLPTT